MSKYIKQLATDLPRWAGLGYVSEPNAALILQDAEANQKEGWFRLPLVLSMLGGLLVFVGIISWVAGNWSELPRLMRVGLLVGAMLLSLLAAHRFRLNGSEGLAQGFAFLAVLMFGADMMLIAQIYQLPANPPGGALLWALGATAMAVLWPSQLNMALAFALFTVWSGFSSNSFRTDVWGLLFRAPQDFHMPFLFVWCALAAYSVQRGWTKAMHVAGLSLVLWYIYTSISIFDDDSFRLAGILSMSLAAFLTLGGTWLKIARPGAGIVSKYLWVLFAFWLVTVSSPDEYRILVRESSDIPVGAYYTAIALGGVGLAFGLRRYQHFAAFVPVAAGFVLAGLVGLLGVSGLAHVAYGDVYYASSGIGALAFWGSVLLAVLVMAAAVGSIVHGYKAAEPFFINLGFVVFATKLLWLYFDNEWGLNNRAAFFVVGGLLVVGLGIVFDRQRRKLILRMKEIA